MPQKRKPGQDYVLNFYMQHIRAISRTRISSSYFKFLIPNSVFSAIYDELLTIIFSEFLWDSRNYLHLLKTKKETEKTTLCYNEKSVIFVTKKRFGLLNGSVFIIF